MNYPQHPKRKRKTALIVLIIVIVGVFIINPPVPHFVTRVVHSVGTPLWNAKNTASFWLSDVSSLLQSKGKLIEENQALRRELKRTELRALSSSLFEEENKSLKEILHRSIKKDYILAVVLLRPSLSPYDTFIIDTGEEEGVSIGDFALVSKVVIGSVTEVFTKTATVTLFSSPGRKVNVIIGPSRLPAEAEGQGGGNFKILLPREIDVTEGDSITIPDINPDIFGIVEHIDREATDAFQTILFKNPINMNEVYFIEVVRKAVRAG